MPLSPTVPGGIRRKPIHAGRGRRDRLPRPSSKFNTKIDAHGARTGSSLNIRFSGCRARAEGLRQAAVVEQVLREDTEREAGIPLNPRVEVQHVDDVGLTDVPRADTAIDITLVAYLVVVQASISGLVVQQEITLRRGREGLLRRIVEVVAHVVGGGSHVDFIEFGVGVVAAETQAP